jgi:hypothetical protein
MNRRIALIAAAYVVAALVPSISQAQATRQKSAPGRGRQMGSAGQG